MLAAENVRTTRQDERFWGTYDGAAGERMDVCHSQGDVRRVRLLIGAGGKGIELGRL